MINQILGKIMGQKDTQEEICQGTLKEIQEEIRQLLEEIQNKLQTVESQNLREDIQEEIANQISLLQRFEEYILKVQKRKPNSIAECIALKSKLKSVKVAVIFLLTIKQRRQEKIVLAKNIRHNLEYFINSKEFLGLTKTFFKRAVREWSAPTKILLGLAIAMPIYSIVIPGVYVVTVTLTTLAKIDTLTASLKNDNPVPNPLKASQIQLFFERSTLIMVAGFAGTFGSIISILIRLKKYQDSDYKGSAAPILVGFAKPLIGTAFGILIFTIINSNIISTIQVPKSQEQEDTNIKYYFFFSIAFIVGFSERLADDIIQRAEGVVIPTETVSKLEEAGENFQNSAKDIQGAGEDLKHGAKDIQGAGEDLKRGAKNIQEAAEDLKYNVVSEQAIHRTESSQADSSQNQKQ
ncbi:hypothetical protein [Nostoc sp. ATCC 53789]|uniref:hypothetical protein n=1 Tax=Nostoc sp. ATCC 53789 TaxID=76335 RepID=UPI000DEC8073|nr:hypothetical protein [Nostoc sp. ATCC 53789]QHG16224.1 hypothetical protein GJB62_09710 [Nostoc sp. ATCC 53789]RCJ20800.1 hypothetical protein A6V25_05450 [Nostoc sp. ATCC 53789]